MPPSPFNYHHSFAYIPLSTTINIQRNNDEAMAEDSDLNRIPRPNVPWAPLQQLHRNSHDIASTASQRIHDLHYCIVQGLTPLITSTSQRSVNNSSRFHRSRPRSSMEYLPSPQEPIQQLEPMSNSQHYVIDIDNQELGHELPQDGSTDSPAVPAEPQQPNNRPSDNSASDMDILRNTPEFQLVISFAEKYVPFILLLLLKLVFDHKLGILVTTGLFVTFFHANNVVKREVSRQGKRHFLSLAWVLLNLVTCIVITYALLAEKGLAFALIFITPYTTTITIWDVLWIASVTDFVIRMMTVLVKLSIVALPTKLILYHKKGKYYLFVERTSQLYRTIAPMQHWLYFFSESYTGPSKVFGVMLSAAYLIFKCKGILHKAKAWKRTLMKMLQSKTYGVAPSISQIKEAGDACPICQDDYKSPAMLQCKHIFCEDCVTMWFDRERTCPICRAQIADDPSWRDGSTSLALQVF